MKFYMPTKLYQEADCVWHHRGEIGQLGKRALIVTGRHSAKANGSYDDVCRALDDQNIGHALFDEVEENPSIETVMKARDFGAEHQADMVIGIGGGSPLDAAKAIALMLKHPDEDRDYLYKKGADSSTLPIVEVPTTCGTGSEVTPVSVLTIHAQKTKGSIPHKIFANYALVDGRYLKTAPVSVLHNTAIDALAHLWEAFINADADDYTHMCVAEGLRVWKRSKAVLLGEKPAADEDYNNMMNASALAGMAIAQDGTTLPHGLSYPVTYNQHMPHGRAVGYFQAGYLAAADKADREAALTMAGFQSLDEYQHFYEALCGSDKLSDQDLDYAVDVLSQKPDKLKKAPFSVDKGVLKKIAFFTK